MDHRFLEDVSLQTPRLLIRRIREEDAKGIFDMMSDQETCDLDGGYRAAEALDARFTGMVRVFAAEPDRYAIVRKNDGALIGIMHLMDPEPVRAVPALEIGYCLCRAYWRQGYGSEAVAELVAYCHDRLRIPLITAGVFDFNAASQRMLEKLGFEREGIMRLAAAHPRRGLVDMVRYVHAAAWQEKASGGTE